MIDIKQIRTTALMTQTEFAKEIGVSCITVMKWEKNKANPSLRHLRRIKEFAIENGIETGDDYD